MSKAIKKIGSMDFWASAPYSGGNNGEVPQYSGPQNYYTKYSSNVGGKVSIDPSIRELQDKGLNGANAIYGDIGNATSRYLSSNDSIRSGLGTAATDFGNNSASVKNDLLSLRDRLTAQQDSLSGNNNAYVQARVNPITRQFGSLRAATQQNLGQRGLGGSSFYDQSMRNIATDQGLQEGDARAIAQNEALNAENQSIQASRGITSDISGVNKDVFNSQMSSLASQYGINSDELGAAFQRAASQSQLNNENYSVAQQRLTEELSALGLSKDQIAQMMGQYNTNVNQNIQNDLAQNDRARTYMDMFKGFGSLASGGGGGGGRGA